MNKEKDISLLRQSTIQRHVVHPPTEINLNYLKLDFAINHGNKRIIEFMDYELHKNYYVHKNAINPHSPMFKLEDLQYHSNPAWLFPVIEKINGLTIDNYGQIGVYIQPGLCRIGPNEIDSIVNTESNEMPLFELVWMTIVKFLDWYKKEIKNDSK